VEDAVSEKKPVSGVVKHSADVPPRAVAAGRATETQVLIGPDDGATNFFLRRFVMGPEGGMPRHTNTIEHEQYVLRGRAKVGIADRVHDVGPGEVLYIPAGTPHFYRVVEAPFEFLCIVPNAPDRIEILEPQGPDERD
jgi:quercetin dioxygenase-like cupin family protein